MKPLEGIKIVELSTYVAAPSCGSLLSYLGADVIKIESVTGEPMRYVKNTPDDNSFIDGLNKNKRSFAADLKNEEVRKYVHKIIAESDAFLTNVRKKALKKLGLDYESLRALSPNLVYGYFFRLRRKGTVGRFACL